LDECFQERYKTNSACELSYSHVNSLIVLSKLICETASKEEAI